MLVITGADLSALELDELKSKPNFKLLKQKPVMFGPLVTQIEGICLHNARPVKIY